MVSQAKTWSRDELILCLDLYVEREQKSGSEKRSRNLEYLRFKHLHTPQQSDIRELTNWVPQWIQTRLFLEFEQPSLFTATHSNLDGVDDAPWQEFYPTISTIVADVTSLSAVLNKMNGYEKSSSKDFRTANCVSQKLCDFLSIDPAYFHWGIKSNTTDVQSTWDEFSQDYERLERVAKRIKSSSGKVSVTDVIEGSDVYPEGKLLFKLHTSRERDQRLVKAKKRQVHKQFGVLRCEVCNFVFNQKYGSLGDDFIECHHTIPVSTLPIDGKTHLKDLALVCSNCHRMLHRRGELLSVAGLQAIIREVTSE